MPVGETLESILLRHGDRGIEAVARTLPPAYCQAAARALLDAPRGRVLIATGFPVLCQNSSVPETPVK